MKRCHAIVGVVAAAGGMLLLVTGGARAADAPPASRTAKQTPAKHDAAKAAPGPAAPAAAPPVTQEEVKTAFEAANYAQAIQLASRALAVKGKAAADYDRYELLMLRGESQLRLKQLKAAADTFGAAVKETKDDNDAAKARAIQYVLRAAKGTTVTRKVAKKGETVKSADLLKPEERENAFKIVYDDLRAGMDPKIKEAMKARTIPPIADVFNSLGELHDLEVAGTGTDSELAATRQELSDRAQKLMTKELDRMKKDVDAIKVSASEIVRESYGSTSSTGTNTRSVTNRVNGAAAANGTVYNPNDTIEVRTIRRGLSDRDRTDLKKAVDTCEKIVKTADSLARVSDGKTAGVDAVIEQAKDVGRDATRVLNAKY
jgi:hypothetical protein